VSRLLGKRKELFLLPSVVVQRPIKRKMNFTPTVSLRARKSSKSTKMGQIQLIMGPMFSGKTTELIRRLKRYQIARYECLIVKYADDDRYDDEGIATHDRQSLKATKAKTLMSKLRSKLDDYDVIGVDEGQFFPDLVEFCEYAAEQGKIVMVSALDGTYQRQGFPAIISLIPLAEHVVKLTAVCMLCFGEGAFTKRISNDQGVEVIGGADKYMAVCRACFKSPVNIPASPRQPLKPVLHLHNTESEAGEEVPVKKALFDETATKNGGPCSGPLAVASIDESGQENQTKENTA